MLHRELHSALLVHVAAPADPHQQPRQSNSTMKHKQTCAPTRSAMITSDSFHSNGALMLDRYSREDRPGMPSGKSFTPLQQ